MQSAPMRVDAVVDFGYFQVRISTEPAAKPAGIAQLVERHVANVKVAGSNPVSRLSRDCDFAQAHEPELVGEWYLPRCQMYLRVP
jgi:hypothetical protein